RLQVDGNALFDLLTNELKKTPEVTGENMQGGQYVSSSLQRLLIDAEKEKERFKDDFLAVEHLTLALMEQPQHRITLFLTERGITKEEMKQEIRQMRGNQRVSTQHPEATYEVLEKYGIDLVQEVKNGKIDPVIGRDTEIRNVIRI